MQFQVMANLLDDLYDMIRYMKISKRRRRLEELDHCERIIHQLRRKYLVEAFKEWMDSDKKAY